MDRKRWLIIAAVVGGVIVVGIGIALISVWPMISGDKVAAGPAPSAEEFAEAALTAPEPLAEAAEEVPDAAAAGVRAAPEAPASTQVKAGSEAAELIAGHWYCEWANDLQAQYSEYFFTPSEDGNTGTLLYYGDPSLDPGDENSWDKADYEVTDDGTLVISSTLAGLGEREYEIEFGSVQDGTGRTYPAMNMKSLAEDDVDMDPAGLVKIAAIDPAWDDWVPENELLASDYPDPTEDQQKLAQEILAAHYPQLAAWTMFVRPGDTEDEEYMGDAFFVYAYYPDSWCCVAMTFYVAPEDSEPVWLDEANLPENYEADEAEDGTQYIWDSESLAVLQGDEVDEKIVDLVFWVVNDYPQIGDTWVYSIDAADDSATVLFTRWYTYPLLPDAGYFEAQYSYNDEGWWDWEESAGSNTD